MSKGLAFWVLMILAVVGWGFGRPWGQAGWGWTSGFVVFCLLFLLGWHNFGFVIR